MSITFKNTTGQTLYLEDVDLSIPFLEEEEQEFSLSYAKRSKSFRKMVATNRFIITKCGDSIFERNLKKMQGTINPASEKSQQQDIPIPPPSGDIEVKVKGHFLDAGGYAKANRNLSLGLRYLGTPVQMDPVNVKNNHLNELEIRQLGVLRAPVSNDAIHLDCMIPSFGSASFSRKKILYTTVESGTVPDQFVQIANAYNEVWVTSDFCKEVLAKEGVKRDIIVLPNSVNTKLYTEQAKPYKFSKNLKKFVFLSVFGWSYRKGYDAR